jgi:hypothetical protein
METQASRTNSTVTIATTNHGLYFSSSYSIRLNDNLTCSLVFVTLRERFVTNHFILSAFLGAFANCEKVAISFVISVRSVCPHGTTWQPLDGF